MRSPTIFALEIIRYAESEFPNVKIKDKKKSLFMKAIYYLSFMWIWNRRFLEGYVTTIGKTIYYPSSSNRSGYPSHALLLHELAHVKQGKKLGILYPILYLFPQIFAIFALLALFHPAFLIFLAALAPWPAPFRARFEFQAYKLGILGEIVYADFDKLYWNHRLENIFTGWGYYRMCWDWSPYHRELENFYESMKGYRQELRRLLDENYSPSREEWNRLFSKLFETALPALF